MIQEIQIERYDGDVKISLTHACCILLLSTLKENVVHYHIDNNASNDDEETGQPTYHAHFGAFIEALTIGGNFVVTQH